MWKPYLRVTNWFIAKKVFSSSVVEGLNTKVKLTIRRPYRFESFKCTEIMLYQMPGKLLIPKLTHECYWLSEIHRGAKDIKLKIWWRLSIN
jgi:hypothetical protein